MKNIELTGSDIAVISGAVLLRITNIEIKIKNAPTAQMCNLYRRQLKHSIELLEKLILLRD